MLAVRVILLITDDQAGNSAAWQRIQKEYRGPGRRSEPRRIGGRGHFPQISANEQIHGIFIILSREVFQDLPQEGFPTANPEGMTFSSAL
jgi:hypothetical protein